MVWAVLYKHGSVVNDGVTGILLNFMASIEMGPARTSEAERRLHT